MKRALEAWVAAVSRRPGLTLLLLLALTVLAAWYSARNFSVETEMSSLIRQEAPWRDHHEVYKEAFPELNNTALVVVSGTSFDAVQHSVAALADGFAARSGFADIFAPMADPFFDRNALLFVSLEQLETITDRLASAQPMLSAVAEGRGLSGILDVIARAIEHAETAELDLLLDPLAGSAEDVVAGGTGDIAWRDRLMADDDDVHYGIISLGKPANEIEPVSDRVFMARTREVIADIGAAPDVDVRITGAIALAHEEIVATQQGVQIAGIISAILLALILGFGIRSLRIILATGLMLAAGVIWTAAWGLLVIGHFNPLSLIFAVVFFGLGVDFAIHYALRFQEALHEHPERKEALRAAAGSVGGAILLCALTTAIGFLAFVPTDYQGLSELGIIAAGGMIVAAILTLTLLPALFSRMRPPRQGLHGTPRTAVLAGRLLRARTAVLITTAVLAGLAALTVPRLNFDHSVLALKNPGAESMRVLQELQREGVANDYTLAVLVPEASAIAPLRARLEALDEVASVETPFDHVPDDQEDKLFLLEDIGFLLGDALYAPSAADNAPLTAERVETLLAVIGAAPSFGAPVDDALQRLAAAMQSVLTGNDTALTAWEAAVTRSLQRELDWLRGALQAGSLAFDDLPEALRLRLRSRDGTWRLAVLPADDISDSDALKRLVESVRAVVPNVTGRPVLEWGVGGVVRNAFVQALALAMLAVAAVLFLALRNLRDALLVLAPLVLAALFTVAVQVLAGVPLNMANILVLPLIFGLGVGNGIHMVQRFRSGSGIDTVLSSSTPRAVLLSALTTIGAFAALSLSPHRGTASIGLLLTIAVTLLLLTVVFLLPVFLASFARRPRGM